MEMEKEQRVPTIAEAAETCLGSFNECLGQLKILDAREQLLLEDELGRFSIWASNIGAFAPRRAALDHRLRLVPDVQRLVRGLLQTMNDHIQSNISAISRSLLENSSRASKIADIDLTPISKDLSLLHRLSNTIRKASRKSQNLRAATNFKITDEEGNDVGLVFRDLFASQLIQMKFPDCSETIRDRLASAMLLRRKRILYRRSRYGSLVNKESASPPKTEQPVADKSEKTGKPGPSKEKSGQSEAGSRAITTATTVTSEQFRKASSPSVIARPKTIRLSGQEEAFFPPAPKGRILQKLKSVRDDHEASHKAHLMSLEHYDLYMQHNGQPPLDSDDLDQLKSSILDAETHLKGKIENETKKCLESTEVVCPYCCCTLSGTDVMTDHKWRGHVKHDLDAYVCLFENCNQGDTLYSYSEEWLTHMREHKIRWRCTARAHGILIFKNQEEYLDHIRSKHKGTETQLHFLADASSRSSGPIFESCPLCGISQLNISLEDHIAGHLRYLALKSLPFVGDYHEHQASDMSVHSSAGIESRSTIAEDSEYGLPLDFDDSPHIRVEQDDLAPPEGSQEAHNTDSRPQPDIFEDEGKRDPIVDDMPRSIHIRRKLPKSIATRPRRSFVCTFSRYGCTSSFASKNEWKRHVASQHLQLGFYRCDVGQCNNSLGNTRPMSCTNDFERKDLFTQHQRRMHAPWAKYHAATEEEKQQYETDLEAVRIRCWHEQRQPPWRSICGFCGEEFVGFQSWNLRMEHIGRHYEKGEVTIESEEKEDIALRDWAIHEGILSWDGGRWKLA